MKNFKNVLKLTFLWLVNSQNINRSADLPWYISKSLGADKDLKDIIDENIYSINKARNALPLSRDEFDNCVLPIIVFIAKYFLYLPVCSKHYNHLGGTFKYSIQSAVNASTIIDKHPEIYKKINYENRHKCQMTCPVAVFLFTLFKSALKPIYNYVVFPCDSIGIIDSKISHWEQTKETVYEWVKTNEIEYYFSNYNYLRTNEEPPLTSRIYLFEIYPFLCKFNHSLLLIEQIHDMWIGSDDELTQEMLKIFEAGVRSSDINVFD